VSDWLFFSNHMHVLTAVARQPDLTLREIASAVGISERATHRIVGELEQDGCLRRIRVGARNRYEVNADAALRHPLHGHCTVGQVIGVVGGKERRPDIFSAAFAAAPGGTVVADEDGRLVAVNSAYCSILGYAEEELLGRGFRDVTHPDDVAEGERARAELLAADGIELVREQRCMPRDGRVVWVKLRAGSMADPTTGRPMIVAHVTDISDRKRRDEALAVAEELFRSAFDNAPIGMALVAPDGRLLKVNRALCELTGYRETELLVGSLESITHPDDLEADPDGGHQVEKRFYHADGHVVWVLLSASVVRDSSGEPAYSVSQIQDVTERRRPVAAPLTA